MTQSSTTSDSPVADNPPTVCANCHYFSGLGGKNICRRSPPSPNFPVVAVDDWCGEFRFNEAINAARRSQILEKLADIRTTREADMAVKPFNGYKSGMGDYVISGYRVICVGSACPEQYEVFDDKTGVQVGYLRLRHGHFRADLRQAGGPCVYSTTTIGDGIFDDKERLPQLKKAVKAIRKALYESVKEAKRGWMKSRD
jgi:hypothetical protein